MPVPHDSLVSVFVLNYNGREHLETCLPSLDAQVYPKDRLRIEVIDNGSADGSVDFVKARFPHVVIHRFDRNYGFAEPYDLIARKSESDLLAFLNNDTRVEPTWLAELVSAAGRHQADCVGSRILDWDGRRIDFVGGLVTFIGHAWQRDAGGDAAHEPPERPLLFACGGSMLISREAYVDAGGFDKDFFAYFEDVDLGWRLSVLGYKTVLAPKAITYHRLHGTAGKIAFAQRLRLYERNALSMLYKNYDDESLRRVLPAAIALSLARGFEHSGLDPRAFTFGVPIPPTVDISARTAVHLLALEDFCRQLPALSRKRADIQARRRVSDREILALFGEPFRLHAEGPYGDIARTLIRDLGIDELFGHPDDHRTAAWVAPTSAGLAPAAAGEPPTVEVGPSLPKVSIVILTALGPTHLPDCLAALRAQTYPADRREMIVVDNGSAEDPRPAVEQGYPGARVIQLDRNAGFAVANNLGAREATGEYLAFLNDDTRAHPNWLQELVSTARRHHAASVGSRILSWDGRLIDFAGASVNFQGRGFQIDLGQPEAGRRIEETPILFACGGAMLVRRDLFLASDGWDEGTFAYYEDVELGWRMWLFGHDVWFAPRSIVYHKHNGTSGRWAEPPRLRLYERNSLRILYTHLERETLSRVLPAALLLSIDRALLATELSRAARDDQELARDRAAGLARQSSGWRDMAIAAKSALRERGVSRQQSLGANLRRLGIRGALEAVRQMARGSPAIAATSRRAAYQIERGAAPTSLDGRTEPIPAGSAGAFCGVYDFLQGLPDLSTRRQRFQALRRRSDRDILSRFNLNWTSPAVSPHQLAHEDVHRALVEALGIAELVK